jgi:lipopolysaccharide export system permease protein
MLARFRPKLINLYLLTEVFGPLVAATVFFVFIFLMFQILRLSDLFIVHGVGFLTLIELAIYMVFMFLPFVLPIAFLLAVLRAFGRLSADSEIAAMKACGVSIQQMLRPILALALGLSIFTFFLCAQWSPSAERNSTSLVIKIGNSKVVRAIQKGTFNADFFNLVLFTDQVDSKGELKKVFIFDERDPKNPMTVVSTSGALKKITGTQIPGQQMLLRLDQGSIHINREGSEDYQRIGFSDYNLVLKLNEGKDAAAGRPRFDDNKQLWKNIREIPPGNPVFRQSPIELLRRYTVSLTPIIFAFLGIGMGISHTRSPRSSAILIAFITLFLFWGLLTTSLALANQGPLLSLLWMALPTLVLGAWARWAIRRVAR